MKGALIVRLTVVLLIAAGLAVCFSSSIREFAVTRWDGLVLARAQSLFDEGKHEAALGWARAPAERGNGDAQLLSGKIHLATENEAEARAWFERAWAAGRDDGAYQLALMHADERWEMHNQQRASEMFALVADRHAGAAAQYGWRLVNGVGVRRDRRSGVAYIQRAAQQQEPEGLFRLGLLQADGIGVSKDAAAAEVSIMQAAKMNHAEAIAWVGDRALEKVDRPGDAPRDCDFIVAANDMMRRTRASVSAEAQTVAAYIGLASACPGAARDDDVRTLTAETPHAMFFTARMIERGQKASLPGLAANVTARGLYERAADAGYERAAVRLDALERADQAALDRLGRYSIERLQQLRSRSVTGWDIVQALRTEHMRRGMVAATDLGVRTSVIGITTNAWVYDVDRMRCRPARQGFRCTYMLRSHFVAQHYDQGGFMSSLMRFARGVAGRSDEETFERTDTFVRGQNGWRSPSYEQALIAQAEEERRRAAAASSNCSWQPDNRRIPMYAGGRLAMVPSYRRTYTC